MGISTCLIGAQEVTPNLLTSTFLGKKKKDTTCILKEGVLPRYSVGRCFLV